MSQSPFNPKLSLYIPVIHKNSHVNTPYPTLEEYIIHIFKEKNIGIVKFVNLKSLTHSNKHAYYGLIHFDYWFDTKMNHQIQKQLNSITTQASISINHDGSKSWTILKYYMKLSAVSSTHMHGDMAVGDASQNANPSVQYITKDSFTQSDEYQQKHAEKMFAMKMARLMEKTHHQESMISKLKNTQAQLKKKLRRLASRQSEDEDSYSEGEYAYLEGEYCGKPIKTKKLRRPTYHDSDSKGEDCSFITPRTKTKRPRSPTQREEVPTLSSYDSKDLSEWLAKLQKQDPEGFSKGLAGPLDSPTSDSDVEEGTRSLTTGPSRTFYTSEELSERLANLQLDERFYSPTPSVEDSGTGAATGVDASATGAGDEYRTSLPGIKLWDKDALSKEFDGPLYPLDPPSKRRRED